MWNPDVRVESDYKTVWHLPLELIDTRYTKLTRKWFCDEFRKLRVNTKLVEGNELTSKIETGSFLDVFGTIHYKTSQIAKVSQLFRDKKIVRGDTFFIDDIWMPGISGIKYMSKMSNTHVSIFGIYHAGSHTPSDDVAVKIGRNNWVKDYERSILKMCDGVFVGSEFHKNEIETYFGEKFDNIFVTGLCYMPKYVKKIGKPKKWKDKEDIVLFPHRIHPEKHPEVFDSLEKLVHNTNPEIKFVKTLEQNLSKTELYKLMGRSKLMFSAAVQENFGYSTLECATLGCDLLLPERVVYPEFYEKRFLYRDGKYDNELLKELAEKIIQKVKSPKGPKKPESLKWVSNSVTRMINKMFEVKYYGKISSTIK